MYGRYLIYGLYKHFVPLSGNVTHVENGWIIQSNLEEYEAYLPYIEVWAETKVGGAFDLVVDGITVCKLPKPKIDPLPLFYDPTGRPVSEQEYDLSMEAHSLNKQAEAIMDAALDPENQWPIFHSPEALITLEEARNESHRARMVLLYSYNYTDAKQHAQNAVDLITKAYNTEQAHQRMQLLIKWSPVIALLVVIGGAVVLILRGKIKKRASCSNLSSQIGSSLCYDVCQGAPWTTTGTADNFCLKSRHFHLYALDSLNSLHQTAFAPNKGTKYVGLSSLLKVGSWRKLHVLFKLLGYVP